MKTETIPNKKTALALNQQAIQGIDKYFAHVKSLTIAGTVYAPANLKATLQAEIDAENSVTEGRAQYKQQVVAANVARSQGRATRKLIKAYVLTNFGVDNVQTLENFGIPVPKSPGRKTAKSKAQAAEKATNTRKAHEEAIASVDAAAAAAPAPTTPVATPPATAVAASVAPSNH
jgi:hypothetical protein